MQLNINGPQHEKMYLRTIFLVKDKHSYFEYMMFLESVSLHLTRLFQLFCELLQIYYMNPSDVFVLKNDVKLRTAFLHVSRAYKTRCICLKLLKHWSEPIVKIEAYNPYRQSLVIILSIFYDDAVAMVTV